MSLTASLQAYYSEFFLTCFDAFVCQRYIFFNVFQLLFFKNRISRKRKSENGSEDVSTTAKKLRVEDEDDDHKEEENPIEQEESLD